MEGILITASGKTINFTEDEGLFRELESSLGLGDFYFEDIAEALKLYSKYNILTKNRALDGFRKGGVLHKHSKEKIELYSKFLLTFEKT
jgi:hypothetical protein